MSFYTGAFLDGDFKVIQGIVERNRDLRTVPGQAPVLVKVGSFTLLRTDD